MVSAIGGGDQPASPPPDALCLLALEVTLWPRTCAATTNDSAGVVRRQRRSAGWRHGGDARRGHRRPGRGRSRARSNLEDQRRPATPLTKIPSDGACSCASCVRQSCRSALARFGSGAVFGRGVRCRVGSCAGAVTAFAWGWRGEPMCDEPAVSRVTSEVVSTIRVGFVGSGAVKIGDDALRQLPRGDDDRSVG